MTAKLDRLNTPAAVKEISDFYQENNILETAEHFQTSHETIRRILINNKVKIRQRGEFTNRTRVLMTAHHCANYIRRADKRLHKSILKELCSIYSYKGG